LERCLSHNDSISREKYLKSSWGKRYIKNRLKDYLTGKALSAILFLYREVLKREIGSLEEVTWAKKPETLPEVLTREEVKAIMVYTHVADKGPLEKFQKKLA
jgi:hypothetical protein